MNDSINQTNAVLLDQTVNGPKYTDQNLRSTDDVVFNTLDTGQGQNELYAMDQNLRTTDFPTFAGQLLEGVSLSKNTHSTSYSDVNQTNSDSNAWNVDRDIRLENDNNLIQFFVTATKNERDGFINVGHRNSNFATSDGTLHLQPFGSEVSVGDKDTTSLLMNSNDILNAGNVQFSDKNGNGNQWAGFERIDGTFRLDSQNNKYDFDPVDSLIYASNSWFTDTGTNAVITSSNNLVKDSGSSRRFKSEIEPANITMDQIMQIEPKHFYHEQIDEYRHGLIAEQVRDAGLDEWVHENQDGEVESLSYGKFGATVALAGLHNHEERIQKLEKAVA